MESYIAALSMSMATANLQNSLSVGMMKKSMESSEQTMETITKMLDNMPSPDGRGTKLNIRV
ncbi:MAG: YjfB family protein [Oscillospiraceae bacterium]